MKDFLSDREHSALPKGHGISFSLILDTGDIMTCTKRLWMPNGKCIILTTNTTTCKDRQGRVLSPRKEHDLKKLTNLHLDNTIGPPGAWGRGNEAFQLSFPVAATAPVLCCSCPVLPMLSSSLKDRAKLTKERNVLPQF